MHPSDLEILNESQLRREFGSSRGDFIHTFLSEMPMGTPATDFLYQIEHDIREKQIYYTTIKVSDNLFKIEGNQLIYYWYESNGNILLGVELSKKPRGLSVNYIGKPNKNGPPYASDLYLDVLRDRKGIEYEGNHIIMSDSKLSDEGFNIWKRLLKDGHKMVVYDKDSPGQSYTEIHTLDELEQYFKHNDPNYQKYTYVLSENMQSIIDIRSMFRLRRTRELSGSL